MRRGRSGFPCVVLLLLALAIPSAGQVAVRTVAEEFLRTLPLGSGGVFQLSNVNGSVYVDAWEKELVEIRAVKSTRGNPLDLERVRVVAEPVAQGVSVKALYPEDDGVEVTVEFRIRVPSRVLLRNVQTVNGSIRIRGVEGAGVLRSVNGGVEVLDGAGRFDARTTNGNIRVELRHLPAGSPISMGTVNGSVVLALPADADAELDVLSMNGDFRSELRLVLKGAAGSRAYRGRLGRGGGAIKVRTVNGGIRVVAARPTV